MQFIATLHPQSNTARDWRSRRRQHGFVHTVKFHWRGGQYSSDPLEPGEAELVKHLHIVRIEMLTAPPPPPEPPIAEAPPENPAPPAPAAAPARVKRNAPKPLTDDELFARLGS